jgi:hypothetical protein
MVNELQTPQCWQRSPGLAVQPARAAQSSFGGSKTDKDTGDKETANK